MSWPVWTASASLGAVTPILTVVAVSPGNVLDQVVSLLYTTVHPSNNDESCDKSISKFSDS